MCSFVREGNMTLEQCDTTLALLTGVLDYELFKDVDMAIEARTTSPSSQLKFCAKMIDL